MSSAYAFIEKHVKVQIKAANTKSWHVFRRGNVTNKTICRAKQAEHFHFTRSRIWMLYSRILGALIICGLLTKYIAKPDLLNDPIVRVYGTYNVCIMFDYEPARSFMAVVWIFISFGIMLHAILFDFRLKIYFARDSYLCKASWYFSFVFTACFSVLILSLLHPPHGSNENVMKHTIPYQVLIIGSLLWWIFNTVCIYNWP